MDKIAKVGEEFYSDLYSSRDNFDDNGRRNSPEELDIPPVAPAVVKKALDAIQRGNAAVGDQVTAGLLKDCLHIVQETLGTLYTQCLMYSSVAEAWKYANIILIHENSDAKD